MWWNQLNIFLLFSVKEYSSDHDNMASECMQQHFSFLVNLDRCFRIDKGSQVVVGHSEERNIIIYIWFLLFLIWRFRFITSASIRSRLGGSWWALQVFGFFWSLRFLFLVLCEQSRLRKLRKSGYARWYSSDNRYERTHQTCQLGLLH